MKPLTLPPFYSDHAHRAHDDYGSDGPGIINKADQRRSGTLQETNASTDDPYRKFIQALILRRLRDAAGAVSRIGLSATRTREQARAQAIAFFEQPETAELLAAIGLLPEHVEAVLDDPPRLEWVFKHINGAGRPRGK